MFKLGDDIDFKIKPGRGRPQHGRILEFQEQHFVVITPGGARLEVPKPTVKGLHVSRYSPRQKRLL